MLTEWLYWILIFLFFATALYFLHIPLPHDIADRSKLAVAEFLLRIFNEYLGDLIENLIGAVPRNNLTRIVMACGFLFKSIPPKGVTKKGRKIGGVRCITYDLEERTSDAVLVFIHGGGWCVGNPRFYHEIMYNLIRKLGCCAVSIDYRLAPEHPYPAGLDDCETVVRELYENGCDGMKFDKNKIIVSGDSAGGNLTASLCQRFKKRNEELVKAQILVYPVTSVFHFNSPSYQEYFTKYAGTALLNPKPMARWMLLYLGISPSKDNIMKVVRSQHLDESIENSSEFQNSVHYENLPPAFKKGYVIRHRKKADQVLVDKFSKIGTNPEVSPLFGDTKGLPPALVMTAGYDILRDEGIQYAQKLTKNGVPTTWKHYPRGYHGLLSMPNSADALEMVHDIVEFAVKYT